MSERRSDDTTRTTAEALIQVAELEFRADGGKPISSDIRDILTHALARELSVAFDRDVSSQDRIANVKAQMRVLGAGVIAIVDREPGNAVAPDRSGRTKERDTESVKGKHALSDALDAHRTRTEAAWNAATARMRSAWVPGRDADRRVRVTKHEPERRCC